jgi:hypothetical protein
MDILEDLIVQYIFAVFSEEQQREMTSRTDIEENLHEDAIDDMKEELFRQIYNNVYWFRILQRIEENCRKEESDEEDNYASGSEEDSGSGGEE